MAQRVYLFRAKDLEHSDKKLKKKDSLENFRRSIEKWKPKNFPCRLSKLYIKNVGLLQNKKLSIISQDNILIIKFNVFQFLYFYFISNLFFQLPCGDSGPYVFKGNCSAVVLLGI